MNGAVIIMAGGAGTRFWPLSTEARPKQFLRLLGDRSLLQESFDRALTLVDAERVLVLSSADLVEEVRRELPDLPEANVVGEPVRRDTAAAVALGSLLCRERWGDPAIFILTADHRIEPVEVFREDLVSAADAAVASGALYTFGIRPTHPATGYGYLQVGEELPTEGRPRHFAVRRFREKPDVETAEGYLSAGSYLWNSGMFVFRSSAVLDEFRRQLPGHLEALEPAVAGGRPTEAALGRAFAELRSVSVDYGIMEGAADVRTVEARFEWNDLGGWLSLGEFLPCDERGNRYRGRLVAHDAASNIVFSEDPDELIAVLGVEDIVVVRAGPRTLVVPKSRCEDIKQLVDELARDGRGMQQ